MDALCVSFEAENYPWRKTLTGVRVQNGLSIQQIACKERERFTYCKLSLTNINSNKHVLENNRNIRYSSKYIISLRTKCKCNNSL